MGLPRRLGGWLSWLIGREGEGCRERGWCLGFGVSMLDGKDGFGW